MARQYSNRTNPNGAISANGAYYLGNFKSFRDVVLEILATNSPDMTVKFYTSDQPAENNGDLPDPTASLATDNVYEISSFNDYKTGEVVAGDTGLVISAEDSRRVEINANFTTHLWAVISNYSAGNLNIWATGSDVGEA